jgi:hypothetical protein
MATDVKNIAAGDTGAVKNGRTVIKLGRAGTLAQRFQSLDSPGYTEFTISGFDTSPPGCVLADRFDDPRYYTGDAIT